MRTEKIRTQPNALLPHSASFTHTQMNRHICCAIQLSWHILKTSANLLCQLFQTFYCRYLYLVITHSLCSHKPYFRELLRNTINNYFLQLYEYAWIRQKSTVYYVPLLILTKETNSNYPFVLKSEYQASLIVLPEWMIPGKIWLTLL